MPTPPPLPPRAGALLRFNGAVEHSPAVERWFDERADTLGRLARAAFERLRAAGPDVRELLHDGFPTACVGDAPFGHVAVYRDHVNLAFFHGAQLPDPAGLLRGQGRHMRHVPLRPAHMPDEAALAALVDAAAHDIRWRLGFVAAGPGFVAAAAPNRR